MIPGEAFAADGEIELNPGRAAVTLPVVNTGDRPVNPALDFDRGAAWGHRLDIPAGTSVRFEPGLAMTVVLVPLVGARVVPGLRPEFAGVLDERGPGA